MVTIFITLGIIGWLISFGVSIAGMVVSWREIDKDGFNESVTLFVLSIPGGWFLGWVMLGFYIKVNWVDKHFDNDKPE